MWLEDEQWELLAKFVEAHRSTPRENRAAFVASQTHNDPEASFLHLRDGPAFTGSLSDAEVLAGAGLLGMRPNSRGSLLFSVLPAGVQAYIEHTTELDPVEAMSEQVRRFIDSSEFRRTHATAFDKWHQAEMQLWAADANKQFTVIGHLCREALQEFVSSLARQKNVDVSAVAPPNTIARLKAVIAAHASTTGGTTSEFLQALVAYWGTLSDLAQRQEHGAQRENQQLLWEDARRVVFHTFMVMFEVSRGLR